MRVNKRLNEAYHAIDSLEDVLKEMSDNCWCDYQMLGNNQALVSFTEDYYYPFNPLAKPLKKIIKNMSKSTPLTLYNVHVELVEKKDNCTTFLVDVNEDANQEFLENRKISSKRVNEAITKKAKEKLNLLNDIVNFAYEYGEDATKSLFQQAFKKVTGDDLLDSLNEEND